MFKEEKSEVTTIEYVDFGTVLTMASSLEARACEVCLTSVLVAGIGISLWLQRKEQSQMKI